MNLTFPSVLGWVLGGNISNLRDSDRMPHCDLDEAPKGFHESVSCLHSTSCPADVCAGLVMHGAQVACVSSELFWPFPLGNVLSRSVCHVAPDLDQTAKGLHSSVGTALPVQPL